MSEDVVFPMMQEQCPVMHSILSTNVFDIILDGNIREPAYYRDAFQVFRQAQKGDRINLILNNSGGRLDSAVCFVNLMRETDAEVVAVLEGDTHSAASIIALNAHGIEVKPYASMMIHHASFGAGGTVQNVMDHVNFTSKQTERLIRETYQFFLSESELDEVIRNREIWLTDEEIGERLDRMFEARQEQGCGDESCTDCTEQPPQETLQELIAKAVQEGIAAYDKKRLQREAKASKMLQPKQPSTKTKKALVEAENIKKIFDKTLDKALETNEEK